MKTKYWSVQIPTNEGWYWIRYKGKRGIVVCPAAVCWFNDGVFFVKTARNDFFSTHDVKRFGKFHFGAAIECPSADLKS